MKGGDKDFNYSSATQFARLLRIVEELSKSKITPRLFLLQINLTYKMYQIQTEKFYNLIFLGAKDVIEKDPRVDNYQDISASLDAIEFYRKKHRL
jgi:hypothetical protein